MNHRQSIVKNLLIYSSGQYVVQGLNFARGLLIARLLDPTLFGLYGLLLLAIQYAPYLDLGVAATAALELSYARGEGDEKRHEDIRGTFCAFTLATYSAMAAIGIAYAALARGPISTEVRLGVAAVAATAFLQQIQAYQIVVWRASNRFDLVTLSNLVIAVASLLTLLLFGTRYKLFAVYASLLISYAGSALVFPGARSSFRLKWDPSTLKSLVRTGIGLMVMNLLVFAYSSVDRLVVARFFDPVTLGQFNFASYIVNGASLIPNALAVVTIPFLAESAGARQSPGELARLLRKLATYLALAVPPIFLSFTVGVQWVTPLFFPKYLPSLPLLLPLAGAAYMYVLSGNSANYLLAAGRKNTLIWIYLLSLLARALGGAALSVAHAPVAWIAAWAIAVGYGSAVAIFALAEKALGASRAEARGQLLSISALALPMASLSLFPLVRAVPAWAEIVALATYVALLARQLIRHDSEALTRLRRKLFPAKEVSLP